MSGVDLREPKREKGDRRPGSSRRVAPGGSGSRAKPPKPSWQCHAGCSAMPALPESDLGFGWVFVIAGRAALHHFLSEFSVGLRKR